MRYVPSLSSLILSHRDLTVKGYSIHIGHYSSYIKNGKRTSLRLQDGCWYLDLEVKVSSIENEKKGGTSQTMFSAITSAMSNAWNSGNKRMHDDASHGAPAAGGARNGAAGSGGGEEVHNARSCKPPSVQQMHNRFHVGWDLLKRMAGRAIYAQDDEGDNSVLPMDCATTLYYLWSR